MLAQIRKNLQKVLFSIDPLLSTAEKDYRIHGESRTGMSLFYREFLALSNTWFALWIKANFVNWVSQACSMGSILQGLFASPNNVSILLERQNLRELANAAIQGFPSPMKHLSAHHWKQIDKQKNLGHMSESLCSFLGKRWWWLEPGSYQGNILPNILHVLIICVLKMWYHKSWKIKCGD